MNEVDNGPTYLNRSNAMTGERAHRESTVLAWLLVVPMVLYVASLFMVRPLSIGGSFSLTLAAPGLLLIGLLTVRIPRDFFIGHIKRVGIEFTLLSILTTFSLLSMVNAEDPIRCFRIIFPSVLPFAIFAHLVFMRFFAPEKIPLIPKFLIVAVILFSVLPLLGSFVLPPLKSHLFGSYRFRGFFENSIQHSISLGVVVPLITVEFATARRLGRKVAWAILLVVMAYTVFRAGSKSAMAVSFGISLLFYMILAFRSRNFVKIAMVMAGMALLAGFMATFGLTIAEKIDPIIAEKIRSIIQGGVSNYQSIESRKLLWAEAIHQGKTHWLVGTGAGEPVLGVTHAHNLILDYFKGIGVFGAAAILLLCLTIVGRTLLKALSVLSGRGDETDIRVLACFLGALIYVICNQLSDCFGPSTVGFLWTVYLTGIFMERTRSESQYRQGPI